MKYYKMFTDGASRGNPGKAGAGVYVTTKDDEGVFSFNDYLGKRTNNQAEYLALLLGLREFKFYIRRHNISAKDISLSIYCDSQLLVRQIKGEYKVRNKELKKLHGDIKDILENDIGDFSIIHIYRDENEIADELANKAIDKEDK